MAAELLKDPNITISDVCYASGFNDTSYFSKQFKLMFGLSPLHYKEKKTLFRVDTKI
jgi:AraC-like DNA-binding protein